MKVPFVDLAAQYQSIKPQVDEAIAKVIAETAFVGGKFVKQFEQDFASFYGVKHCISCANGTDSLFIIMKMLGIGPGDEVITPANSWISSSETITLTGARPVFVDIDPDYYSLDERLVKAKITPRTRAIMAVHLHGQPCQMDAFDTLSKEHNLPLIEDCAQSHVSEFRSKKVGLFGVAASFSFYPGKNLGAYGDAGCIITNSDALAERCMIYARHGALIKHQHVVEGINSRLDGLQAAVLSAKLPHLLDWTKLRIECANTYSRLLADVKEVDLPQVRPESRHTFHLYVVRVPQRAAMQAYLSERGIETAVHYPTPLPFLEAYRYLGYQPSDFPISWRYKDEILSLPLYPELTQEQIAYTVECIKSFLATIGKETSLTARESS